MSAIAAGLADYAYDDFGRKIRETDALSKFWSFEYDVNNNVTKATDAKNQVTTYTWGYGHQLMTRTSTSGTLTYTRNALGQPLTAQSPEVTYTYAYDANHRTTSVTDSRGNKTLNYNYSPGGMLNYMTDSDNNRTDYLYDAVGRLVGIFAPNYEYVTFRYDQGGRLTEKWFPNGVNTRYTYNSDNTLSQLVNRTSTSSIISQHDYTYDGVGNRQTHTELIGTTTTPYYYAYDELNRLKEVRNTNASGALIEGYTYDPLGNRLTKTDSSANTVYYIYDATDVTRLKEVRQGSITGAVLASMLYDDNGNMTSKTEGATTTSMLYDALNRLTQVSKTGLSSQSYAYDDQGRRIAKTVGATTTSFLYNGPDIVAEYASWTAPNAQYTHGPNTDDPIIRQAGALAQYFHQDGLGSVVGLSNNADSTTATQRFDAWGNKIASSGTIPQYGYTGREPDETGLVYYRARFYDPTIGRFTQRDPIGLSGGVNQYAYVGGNPVNFSDPMGLQAFNNSYANTVTQATSYYGSSMNQASSPTQQEKPVYWAANDDGTRTDASSGMMTAGSQKMPQGSNTTSSGYSGLSGFAMQAGELLRGSSVNETIKQYSQVINQAAQNNNVSAALVKAIIFEEQTHLTPFVESSTLERIGVGKTVGLGQITVGKYGYSREQLLNPETNINAIATHLKNVQDQLIAQGIEPTPAAVGTRYNCGSCKAITNYGQRVEGFAQKYDK